MLDWNTGTGRDKFGRKQCQSSTRDCCVGHQVRSKKETEIDNGKSRRGWELRLRTGGHRSCKVIAQTLPLNSNVLSGIMGRSARKRLNQDLRKEYWNLFDKKIKGRLRSIWESALILWDLAEERRIGPTYLGLRGARRIVEMEDWIFKDKGRREQAWGMEGEGSMSSSHSRTPKATVEAKISPGLGMLPCCSKYWWNSSVKQEDNNLSLPSDEQLTQMVETQVADQREFFFMPDFF